MAPPGTLREREWKRFSGMKTERHSFINQYMQVSNFIQPRVGRYFISDRNKGDRRWNNIINSRGTQATRIATAGLFNGVMSPSRPWFKLGSPDAELNEFGPAKQWLEDVATLMRSVFNAGNLYNMAPVMLRELLLFGTSCMSHVNDFEDIARFYSHTAGSYVIAQDDRYQINTVGREFEMTVEQIMRQFHAGGKISSKVRDAYDNGNYDSWYPVIHMVDANPEFIPGNPFKERKKFRELYFEPSGTQGNGDLLSTSGYDEFPFYTPRWDVTGEDIYGTDCPGMTALGDTKGLQHEEKRKAQALDKMVSPPLHGPPSLRNTVVGSLPGNVTTYEANNGQGLKPIYEVRPQIGELVQDMDRVEARINEAFYVDLFKAITNMQGVQPRNQLEINQRNEERLLQLGPVLERLHGEFLNRLIDRTFAQMVKANVLPPAPEELSESPLKVTYISTLAMAQRAVQTGSIDRLVGFIGGLQEVGFTEARHKFDAVQAVDEYAEFLGVPPTVIRSDEETQQRLEAEQQQQQQMQQIAMAGEAANIAKTAGEADINLAEAAGAVGPAQ